MITKDEITKIINELFEEYFELESSELQAEAHLFEDLGLDSLDIVDLVVVMQEKFGVNLRDDENLKEIRTLDDVYNYIDGIKDQFTV